MRHHRCLSFVGGRLSLGLAVLGLTVVSLVATPAAAAAQTATASPSPGGDLLPCIPGVTSASLTTTVPDGVGSVQLVAWGGSGQSIPGASGGKGAAVSATVPVKSGDKLQLQAGCAGAGDAGKIPTSQGTITQIPGTGFSNGGAGGKGALEDSSVAFGGNGGGSSGVQNLTTGQVLLVAAGGGAGGAAGQVRSDGGNGGCGGLSGCSGGSGTGTHHVPGGTGGGGAAAANGQVGSDASGFQTVTYRLGGGGGGGGGGYPRGGNGGGGGECLSCGGGGGGGGSSFVLPAASNVTVVDGGADVGEGFVMYTWISTGVPAPTVSTFKCANGNAATYTVPPATYNITSWAFGAAGASSHGTDNGAGSGDAVTANLFVHPGDTMSLTAGCPASGPTGGAGWASGGQAGITGLFGLFSGGGGGGASGIVDSVLNTSRVVQVVAGGGGGAGFGLGSFPGGAGGYNRFTKTDGQPGRATGSFVPAAGGTAGGASGSDGAPGGGSSGNRQQIGGGGGGGGYRGGGGGAVGTTSGSAGSSAGGGGEGMSFVEPDTTTSGHITNGGGRASGLIVLVAEAFAKPAAPTGVSATAGNQQATVSFTPPATDGGAPIRSYTVYAFPGGVPTAGTSSPITVRNLTPGTQFTFTVSATNIAGEGPQSTPSSGVVPYRLPGAPVIQSATTGDHSVTVAFQPSAADLKLGNPITSYTATARLGVNVTSGPGITATSTSSPITVSGLTDGQNYTVTVYATNLAGNGPESLPKVVFPETVPGAPTNLVATNATPAGATSGSVSLMLTPPADTGGVPIQSYTVTAQPGGITAVSGATTVVVGGLHLGTSYTFTAHATNSAGSGSESTPSNAVVPTPVGVPSPPVVPAATPNDQMAFVSFLPPFDSGGSPIASYTVTSQPGGITATGVSSPILVMGLTNGTTYTFTVTATNTAGGTSQPSQATPPVTPRVPSGPAPANDNFANAQAISGASGSVSNTNVGATVEPSEPTIQDQAGGASVWYRWTAPTSGTVRFDTCTAYPAMDPNIEAFIGNSVSNITPWGPGPGRDCPANQFGSEVTFIVSANQTIYVKLDGVKLGGNASSPSEGPFTLEWAMQ